MLRRRRRMPYYSRMLPTLCRPGWTFGIVNVSVFMMQWPLTAFWTASWGDMRALHATCYKIYGTRVCATRGTVTPHSPAPSYSFLWPYALPLPRPQSFPVPGIHVGRICSAARREFSSFLNVYFIISFWRPTTKPFAACRSFTSLSLWFLSFCRCRSTL